MNGHPDDSLSYGVGIMCSSCSTTIRNCIIKNNSGVQWGAGIRIHGAWTTPPVIVNTIFVGNTSSLGASAVSVYQTPATFLNCTFTGNTGGSSVIVGPNNVSITNSIVWNNNPGDIAGPNPGVTPNITYSDVEGGYSGVENIDTDPFFSNSPNLWDRTTAEGTTTTIEVSNSEIYSVNDVIEIDDDGVPRTVTAVVDNTSNFTVEFIPPLVDASEAGVLIQNWGTGATDLEEDFQLYPSSLCIDAGYNLELMAGDPNRDINANPRFIAGDGDDNMTVDMGAYEYGDICECDSETPMDLDTDGLDLAYYISTPGSFGVSTLAEDFGRVDCPNYKYTP